MNTLEINLINKIIDSLSPNWSEIIITGCISFIVGLAIAYFAGKFAGKFAVYFTKDYEKQKEINIISEKLISELCNLIFNINSSLNIRDSIIDSIERTGSFNPSPSLSIGSINQDIFNITVIKKYELKVITDEELETNPLNTITLQRCFSRINSTTIGLNHNIHQGINEDRLKLLDNLFNEYIFHSYYYILTIKKLLISLERENNPLIFDLDSEMYKEVISIYDKLKHQEISQPKIYKKFFESIINNNNTFDSIVTPKIAEELNIDEEYVYNLAIQFINILKEKEKQS